MSSPPAFRRSLMPINWGAGCPQVPTGGLMTSRFLYARRDFIAVIGAAALARPAAALAQDPVRRLGMLMPFLEDDPEAGTRVAALLQKLQELGWAVGRNLRIEARWSGADLGRTRNAAAELAASAPDVTLDAGTPALTALTDKTRSVPIVFVAVPDPVGQSLVANVARPGGNATGFANLDFPVGGKWLELLKAIAPDVTRVALLFNPQTSAGGGANFVRLLDEGAHSFSIQPIAGPVHEPGEIDRTVEAFAVIE